MSEQTLDYFTCVMSVLNDDGLLLSKQIDTSDSTYASWKAGTLSPRDYLKYCISKQWIDITKLDVDQKYADSSEIYTALCSYIRDAMTDNKRLCQNYIQIYGKFRSGHWTAAVPSAF